MSKALDKQVGGGHYKDMAIQPIEFTHKNNLNFCQGNIVKYACRYKAKNGIEDLKKVIHYAELLIELEYAEEDFKCAHEKTIVWEPHLAGARKCTNCGKVYNGNTGEWANG